MSDILKYTLDLRDNISSKLRAIGINNEQQLSTWSKVQMSVQTASATMNSMGRTIGSLQQRVNALKEQKEWIPASNRAAIRATNHEIQALEKEITKLNNLNGGKIRKWMGDIKNSIPGFVNPVSAAIVGMGKVIQTGMNAEMQKTNLRTLFRGNEQAAEEMYSKITGYAIKTPYEKTDLIEGQKLMMSFGISSEKSFSTLKQLGDISMGDSEKMRSLTLAFSQATSAGKLQGQDLLQMINAGFNPLQVISERTGESMASLKDRMKDGKISADELSKAFQWATDKQGLFYQGAEKASKTPKGKASNLQDTLSEIAISLYDNVISLVLSPLMDLIGKVFAAILNGFSWFIEQINKGNPVLLSLSAIIGTITLAFIVFNTWQKITAIWSGIITFFKHGEAAAWWAATAPMLITVGIIAAIIAAIVAIVAAIIYAVKHITGWGKTWQNITGYMGLAMELFKDKVSLVWLQIKDYFVTGFETIEKGWYKLQSLWDKDAANAGLAKIQDQRNQRAEEIAGAKGKVAAVRDQMKEMTVWELKSDGTSFTDFIAKSTKKVKSVMGLGDAASTIAPPSIPGIPVNPETGDNENKNNDNKNRTDAIASGGTRNTSINIQFKNMVEKIVFDGTLADQRTNIQREVESIMARVLAMAQSTA